jgi:hypothetical protein
MSRKHEIDVSDPAVAQDSADRRLSRRSLIGAGAAAAATAALSTPVLAQALKAAAETQIRFHRVPTQFIAALADPDATSGNNAQTWGLWRQDPGPRGVRLDYFDRLQAQGGVAPAQWKFDPKDWWLEEHGLIMEQPEFPLDPGMYVVTGNRSTQAVLTVDAMASDGTQHWSLDNDATLYDVTHLGCRSARYTPPAGAGTCSPAKAKQSDFPVSPGAEMPPVAGCNKQDYQVLIVIGVGEAV